MWPFSRRPKPEPEPEPPRNPSVEQIQEVQSRLNLRSDSGGMAWTFTGGETQYSGKIYGTYADGRVTRWRWTLNNRQTLPHQNYTGSIDEALHQISRQIAVELIERSYARAHMRVQADAIGSAVEIYLEKRRKEKNDAVDRARDRPRDSKPDGSHGFYG